MYSGIGRFQMCEIGKYSQWIVIEIQIDGFDFYEIFQSVIDLSVCSEHGINDTTSTGLLDTVDSEYFGYCLTCQYDNPPILDLTAIFSILE